nr:hypothetical protein [Fimbriimonadaceae bacterium]
IPSIEQLVEFDWNKLSETLTNLEFEDIVNLNNLISNLEGKLLEFLPPGMDKSIAALRDMLKEFGLPSSLSEAYDELKKKVETPVPPPTPSPFPPGVFVNKHRMARVGLTFMAHGAVPLAGPAAKTVFIETMPVWRAIMDYHTCPMPVAAPPAPDGPGFCSGGYDKVLVEFGKACQHDIEGIDMPLCGKTNLFLTQGLAKSAWEKIKAQGGGLEEHETEKPAAAGGGSGGGGTDKEKPEEPPEKKDDEQNKDKNIPPTAAVTLIRSTAKSLKSGKYEPGGLFEISGDQSSDSDGTIVLYSWYAYGSSPGNTFTVEIQGGSNTGPQLTKVYIFAEKPGIYTVGLVVEDDDGARSSNLAQLTFEVAQPPVALITPKAIGTVANERFVFESASYDPDNESASEKGIVYHDWKVTARSWRGTKHTKAFEGKAVTTIEFQMDQIVTNFAGEIDIELIVTDIDGLKSEPVKTESFAVSYDWSWDAMFKRLGIFSDHLLDTVGDAVKDCAVSKLKNLVETLVLEQMHVGGPPLADWNKYVEKVRKDYDQIVVPLLNKDIEEASKGILTSCIKSVVKAMVKNDLAMSKAEKDWSERALKGVDFVIDFIDEFEGRIIDPIAAFVAKEALSFILDRSFEIWLSEKRKEWKKLYG